MRHILTAALVALSMVAVACGSGTGSAGRTTTTRTRFSGYVRSPAPNVGGVVLPSTDGTPVKMVAEPGGLLLVYFGYTFCPDVCPTTLAYVKKALASLPAAERERVRLVMVTIDPARDTAQKLATYVASFVPDGTAVRTDDQELLRSATAAFSADYKVVAGADGQEEVSHTGDLYAVDDKGEVMIAWPFGSTYKAISGDLTRLLDGQRPPSDR